MSRREWQDPPIHEHDGAAGKVFFIRYRVKVLEMGDGKPAIKRREKWVSLGPVASGLRAAQRKKAEIMREVNAQCYTIQSNIPFEDFLNVWRQEHYRGLKHTSQDYYDQRIDRWILPALAGRKLGSIGPLDVSQILGAMEAAGVARSTRIATRTILYTIFRRAKRWGYLQSAENPATDAEVGRSAGAAREQWTPTLEEARAVIGAADPDIALMLESVIWTGMRVSELLGLRCKSVDLARGVAYVVERQVRGDVDKPKSKNSTRPLPLGHLAQHLAPLMAGPDDYVFRSASGGPLEDNMLNRRVRIALKAVGLYHSGNVWHAFRRCHLTLMSHQVSLFDLRSQAGHANISTTQRYVAQDLGARTLAVEGMQAKVLPFERKKTA